MNFILSAIYKNKSCAKKVWALPRHIGADKVAVGVCAGCMLLLCGLVYRDIIPVISEAYCLPTGSDVPLERITSCLL